MPSPYRKKGVELTRICKYFQEGRCFNKRCPYLHVKPDSLTPLEDKGAAGILAAMLKLFLEKQQNCIYSKETGLFNLSNLASYSELESIGGTLNFNSVLFCNTLCACIRDTITPFPSFFQFDNNNIKSIGPLTDGFRQKNLSENVLALSFANNEIKGLDLVDHLKCFPRLQEVIFTNNPVAKLPDYKNTLKKEILSLRSIDCSPTRGLPLRLLWPKFYSLASGNLESLKANSRSLAHTALQENIIQFVLSSIIEPLKESSGVDAVSDFYSRNALFSISFEEEAAICTSAVDCTNLHRNVVRDIVALRLRQKEVNHNLLRGGKSSLVACGRTQVCMTLQDVFYQKNVSVSHLIHPSINVSVLDNTDESCGMGLLHEPFSLVSLHGIISWIYNPSSHPCVIRRNFGRTLAIAMGEQGRWQVTNDMIFLRAYQSIDPASPQFSDILYTPWEDFTMRRRLSIAFDVPEPVVACLANCLIDVIERETELTEILSDLSSIPLTQYEYNAVACNGNQLASIVLCRLQKVFGLHDIQQGVELIQKYGLDWNGLKTTLLNRSEGDNA